MRKRRKTWMTALLIVSLTLPLLNAPLVVSDNIPIITYILNAGPEVLDVSVLGEGSQIWVDPGSIFHVKVRVRDNNTLADVDGMFVEARNRYGDHPELRLCEDSVWAGYRGREPEPGLGAAGPPATEAEANLTASEF